MLNGRLFATGSADGGARIWAFSDTDLDPLASSADSSLINDTSSSSSIRSRPILRTESGHFPVLLDHGAENQVYSVIFSAGFGHAVGGGPTLVTAADDAVQCWDLNRVLQEKPSSSATMTAAASAAERGSKGAASAARDSNGSSNNTESSLPENLATALPTSRTYSSGGSSELSGVIASSWRFAAEAGAPVYGGSQRNANQAAYIFDLALSSQPVTNLGGNSSRGSSNGGFAGTNSLLAAALSDGTCRISSFGVAASLAPSSSSSSNDGRPAKSAAVARAGEVAVLSTGGDFGHLTSVAWAPVSTNNV